MRPNYQLPGYPIAESILCPACGKRCNAQKHFYAGDGFQSLVHNCEHCGYTITESEWNPTPVQRPPRRRILRFYAPASRGSAGLLELLAKVCLVIFVAGVVAGVVILCLAVLALAAGG